MNFLDENKLCLVLRDYWTSFSQLFSSFIKRIIPEYSSNLECVDFIRTENFSLKLFASYMQVSVNSFQLNIPSLFCSLKEINSSSSAL